MPRSRRAWVYGRTASSTASCISCSKKTGWQTNHLSLQALRLTNEVISAFSGHKQGKFVRKGFQILSDTHDVIKPKVFIAHVLVLLRFTCNSSSTGTRQQT